MGTILSGTIYEDNSVTLLGQIIDLSDGSLLVAADFGTITYGIWDSAGTQIVAAGTSVTVGDGSTGAIRNTAITNTKLWGLDSTGANFYLTIAKDVLVTANTEYHIEVEFNPSGGEQFGAVWIVNTRAWNTS